MYPKCISNFGMIGTQNVGNGDSQGPTFPRFQIPEGLGKRTPQLTPPYTKVTHVSFLYVIRCEHQVENLQLIWQDIQFDIV